MKLDRIRLSGFQAFGPIMTEISFEKLTFLIGPNGAGKTAVLQALCRLFAFDPSLRRVQKSDFHIPVDEDENEPPASRNLLIEADFLLPELAGEAEHPTIPLFLNHMWLDRAEGVPRIGFRLSAKLEADGEIIETLTFIRGLDDNPFTNSNVTHADRNRIHVHYLPAKRDPTDHIAYSANALLGRVLRAVKWDSEREKIQELSNTITQSLIANASISLLSANLAHSWKNLHYGNFFKDPHITFFANEIESLLRLMSVSFSPGHGEKLIDFERLSDGQKSMLYLSLVLSILGVGRAALVGETTGLDLEKLRPPAFTLIAMEEPENSLSPHYLGRIVSLLSNLVEQGDSQALIATHSPSILRRVNPNTIRYLRLNKFRQTQVSQITLPPDADTASKYVAEAVKAFPELYFSRLIVLGEGPSEEIVLERLLKIKGVPIDEATVSIVPLGGRHVNHFWRLLTDLNIPFFTLIDLDLSRHLGGWGRIKYILDKIQDVAPQPIREVVQHLDAPPHWNDVRMPFRGNGEPYLVTLEKAGVFFSEPLDIDFSMLKSFPHAFGLEESDFNLPADADLKSVLGDGYHYSGQFDEDELRLFKAYHKQFLTKRGKPAAHLNALASLTDAELLSGAPPSLLRLADAVVAKLRELPE